MLSRLVDKEFRDNNNVALSAELREMFTSASWVIGNLEGSVGEIADCPDRVSSNLCFYTDPARIKFLSRSGFKAMGMENNHSMDTGIDGRRATRESLINEKIVPLEYDKSPVFIKINYLTIGIIPFSLIPDASGEFVNIPSTQLLRRLQKARALSDLVVVYVHWGKELQDWGSASMLEHTDWLTRNGADLIVGSHPHVVIEPGCVNGKPVFYSLGNFLFDQKYLQTQRGHIVECDVFSEEKQLECAYSAIQRSEESYIPELAERSPYDKNTLQDCILDFNRPITIQDISVRARSEPDNYDGRIILEGWQNDKLLWETSPTNLIEISKGRFGQGEDEYLFTLEKHFSDIDHEYAPRPYVYRITDRGLAALWRGSALAWPIKDATVLCDDKCYVCALHRGDSFLIPDPQTEKTRVALYEWNGFGFSGIDGNQLLQDKCEDYYKDF